MTCDSFPGGTRLGLSFRRAQQGGILALEGACSDRSSDSSRAFEALHGFIVDARLLRNLPRGGGLRSENIAISGGLMFQPTEDALLVLAFIFLGP